MAGKQATPPLGVPGVAQTPAFDPSAATRYLKARTAEAARDATAARGAQMAAVADPNCKQVGYKLGFQDTGRLCIGWIVDGTSIANCYRVQVEKGRAPLTAAACAHNSHACIGAKSINTYAPGTPVVLMIHDKMDLAYILGAVPSVLDIAYRGFHDYISQTSRKRVDDCQKKYLKLPNSGSMSDLSAWRPIDQTLASEWGAISTTGMGISLDDFLIKLSVNEFTGVFGFYHDSMLRVSGYNMQTWTGGHERDALVDQGEYNDYQGYSPYPWEAIGLLKTGTENVEVYDPKTYLQSKGKPFYAHFENKHEYQQPYHRTQQFYGYLGQGWRSVVQAPPEDAERWMYKPGKTESPGKVFDSEVQAENTKTPQAEPGADKLKDFDIEDKPPIGLHEDNVGLDGRRFIASAKGIVLAKRMLLPMPTRLKRPEAGDGDDALSSGDNKYRAAGMEGMGDGPEHKITGDIEATDEFPGLQRAAGVMDLHAYLFNYAGLHPFHWHSKDYKTWEQDELKYAQVNHRIPDFGALKGSMYLETPKPLDTPIKIDHRYKQQDFYETTSHISLLDDGSVVIGDGYGAEIRMSAGVVTISAPGDVWLKSGRHTQVWAGGDAITRANGSVEMSTTKKSVRIKAEQDVMVLAGNSGGRGGVLIESRSPLQEYDFEQLGDDVSFGGVVLRAPKSNVVGLAHQIYLRTGGDGSSIAPGNITIDAGKGEADLVTKSNQVFHYVGENGQIYHFFRASADSTTQKANYFSSNFTLLTGPLGVDGPAIIAGPVFANGSFITNQGHIITQEADAGNRFVTPCNGKCQAQVEEAIAKIREYVKIILPKTGDQVDESYLEGLWYDNKQPGNKRVIDIMEFSFRNDKQYNVPNFMLYEDRWQQMARLASQSPEKWTETPVTQQVGEPTYPFPGKKWLVDQDAYATQDMTIVEYVDGGLRDKKRNSGSGDLAEEYKTPKFGSSAESKKKINGEYPIIGTN